VNTNSIVRNDLQSCISPCFVAVENEQLYSSAIERERKKTKKTKYNKHQNTIDMQDYQAVTYV